MENKDYILFLTKWYPNYEDPQLGVFVKKHAELLAQDYKVKLIYVCPIWKSKKPKVEYQKRGDLEEYIVYYRPLKGLLKMFNPYLYYRFQKEVYKSFGTKPKHVFVNIGSRPGLLMMKNILKEGVPFSLIEHWSGFVNGKFSNKPFYKKNYYRKLAHRASNVFAVSEFLKKGMEKETGMENIKVLPNVIEFSKSTFPDKKEDILITIGDLEDEVKNVSGLIKAFANIHNQIDSFRLQIIGGGSSESELEKLAKDLGIGEKVEFLGRLENSKTLEYLNKAKICISNSNFETFGMTLAESLSMAIPVISTKSGGPEEFLNEENSILIEKKNQPELEKAILEMVANYEKYDLQKVAESNRERFDSEKILNILKEVITSPRD